MGFDTRLLEKMLLGAARSCRAVAFSHLASSNTTAKQMAADGAPDGTVVIAESQSAGRGRMQRSFFSPDGTGLYMSVLLRRPLSAAMAVRLTPTVAVCVAEAIEAVSGRTACIKWINDVYLDGKKACGILTESALGADGTLDFAVVGIGVNVLPPQEGFPPEIADIATAVLPKGAEAADVRERLTAEILNRLYAALENLGSPDILSEYRRRVLLLGERVFVRRMDEEGREAIALSVDENFRLHVRTADGSEEILDSGEVSVKKTI